jgi:streptogramin lyase
MQPVRRRLLWAALAVIFVTGQLSASETEIHGVVTDNAGKPVRGALVKATTSDKSVSRFTQKDGRYEITVPAGSYDVTVDAYGFAPKRQAKVTPQAAGTNFSLTPRYDMARLTSAELQSLLPDNSQTKLIRAYCIACHSFGMIIMKRGYTASEWRGFIPTMTRGRLPTPTLTDILAHPEKLAALSAALETYFGPDAPYFGPDADPLTPEQIKHADLSDAVLKATIREYAIPTPDPFPHSVSIDQQDKAWFSELGPRANKVGRFDPVTEKFEEYPVPIPEAAPHTGVASEDGRYFWDTLIGAVPAKLASVDRETGKVKTYDFPGNNAITHTVALDAAGNVWCSGTKLLKFNVKTESFQEYKMPVLPTDPENTMEAWEDIPGQAPAPGAGFVYDVQVDSKGNVWVSIQALGLLVRLDPATGETKTYYPPGIPSVKGLAVDAQDNIWFAGHQGNKLGRLDPKTGAFNLYRPPTDFATPYGLALDKKSGYVWLADLNGNNVTRFDPKTEQFAEYPIPSSNASPRFIGLDSKGRVWFTEFMNGKIGVIDPGEEGGGKGSK